jgi:hypothetical protein
MKALVALAQHLRLYRAQGSDYLFALAGLGWVFCGALVLGLSTSATHEITACLLISFGVMFLGLSAVLGQIRTLGATWVPSAPPKFLPPPVPVGYAIPIDEAIDGVRTSVRLTERHAWIQSFNESLAEPISHSLDEDPPSRISYLRSGILPAALPAPLELVEIDGEYHVGPPETSDIATALSRLQQIFSG